MRAAVDGSYMVGRQINLMPIGIVDDASTRVNAGPVLLVVEKRQLTDEIIAATLLAQRSAHCAAARANREDTGVSVHVVDPDTDLEYLRFDCFEHDPHYHYLRHEPLLNIIVQIDKVAEGDPFQWTLQHLASRLPGMLEYAGARSLADAVTSRHEEVLAGVADLAAAAAKLKGLARTTQSR